LLQFSNKKLLALIVSIVLSIGMMSYVLKDIPWQSIVTEFKNANYYFVLYAGCALFFSHFLRAIRWKIIIEISEEKVKTQSVLIAFLIGNVSNFILPHVGEIVRCTVLGKLQNTKNDTVFGTVLLERVLDAIVIVFLFLIVIIFDFQKIKNAMLTITPVSNTAIISGIVVLILLVLCFIIVTKNKGNVVLQKLNGIIKNVSVGFLSFKNIQHPFRFICLTIAIWSLYIISSYFILHAINANFYFSFILICAVLGMSSIGFAGPTQGGIGAYHLLISTTLQVYGFSKLVSLSAAIGSHALFMFFDCLFGIVALLIYTISLNKTKKSFLKKQLIEPFLTSK
jgi:glycosyltransferase 2 family protein